jgi:PAS domain S-box-containing protein
MTGYSKEEVIGRTPGAFVKSGYHDAAFYEKMWDTILKGNIWQGELINKRKDGVTSFEEMTITPLMNSEGVVTQFIAIKQDVSKRKRTEAALEKRVLALTQPMETAIKINFEDLFNLSDIQKLQDEFARATGVASIITYPDGTPITRPSNFCRLCEEIIRKTKKGAFNCYQSDAALGKFNSEGPSIQPCKSGGLWDAGAGITVGGQHIANWLIGQVRDQTQTEDAMRTYADEIGVDQEIFIDAFQEVPSMSSDQFSHIAQALYTLANQLSTTAFQNVQQARFIADRNRVEVQLKENNEKLQTIINTSLDGYFILTEDGSIQEVNNEYCKMTGYSRDELLQMTIVDLDAQENSQDALAHIQKVVEKGTDQFETQHRCKDGSLIDIEISTTYLKSKEYLLTFARNISERKRSEKQLIQLSERFAIATDSAGIGIWELDLISNTLVWDKWMYRLYGIQPEDFGNIYESWQTFIHPEDKDQTFEAVEQAIRGEKDYDLTFRIIQPDGNIRYLKAFAFVIRDKNNRPIRMTGVNYDVTDRKQAMLEKEIALTNLRERENLLSKIFEILPVGLWIADKNGNLIQSNIAGRKIWGAEPLVGMKEFGMFKARRLPSGEEIKPDDWALAQTIRDGKTITDEVLEIDAFDGVKRTILNYSAPVFDNEGKIENAVVVNLDISERKQIEKALLQSEEQYQLLFNEMAEGFALHEIICDDLGVPVDYRFLEVNPMFEKMTGLKKEKIIGKTVLEVKPNTESYWIQTYGQVALTGKEIRYENYSEEFGKWFDVIAFSPKPGQFATTFNDVTDQKLMEIEIRESEEKYRTYVNQAPFGVFVTDENGNYLQVNEAASKITGYTSAELLKMKIPDLLPEQIYEAAAEYFESVKNHGYDFGEFQFLIKNQEIRWFSVTGVKLSENRILSFVEDITDRKQADMKLQEQLDELTRWHSATLGRENRIMELKKEVNQLLKKHNLPVRYTSIEESLYE